MEAAIKIAIEQNINPHLFEWNDETGIANHIIDDNLLEKMKVLMKDKMAERFLD